MSKKVAVMKVGGSFLVIVNPEIVWKSEAQVIMEEGCLSLPDIWINISRPSEVILKFFDQNGKEQERKFSGVDARAAQHEIDHLDGKLFVDYLSTLKRHRIRAKLEKEHKKPV